MELEMPEEFEDRTLLGNRVEAFINVIVPASIIKAYKERGCNCSLRRDLLNNWHLIYREYKQNVKEKNHENIEGDIS